MNKRGFTLIELMVALAIISVLSSIIIASLGNARSNSKDAKRVADIKSLQIALSQYYADNNKYPQTLSPLAPTYIGVKPKDPNGGDYKYAALCIGGAACNCANVTRYHLGAVFDSTNPAINEDFDNTSITAPGDVIGGTAFYACSNSDTDFVGQSSDCGDTQGTDKCYDVIN